MIKGKSQKTKDNQHKNMSYMMGIHEKLKIVDIYHEHITES